MRLLKRFIGISLLLFSTTFSKTDWVEKSIGGPSTESSIDLRGIIWNGKQVVIVGDAGTILTSPDGLIWNSVVLDTANWLRALTWTGKQFVAVGVSGASSFWGGNGTQSVILTSPDGKVWTKRSSRTSEALSGITWTGKLLIAVGQANPMEPNAHGTVLTSMDGITWSSRNVRNSQVLSGVAWTGKLLAAVGDSGTILTSPDGINWKERHIEFSDFDLEAITWTGNQLVAVGGDDSGGVILTSKDGIAWTKKRNKSTAYLYGVVWTGKQLLASGWQGEAVYDMKGIVLSSSDGLSWNPKRTSSANMLFAVTSVGERIIAVGTSGVILISKQ